jgi:hypothetical protein
MTLNTIEALTVANGGLGRAVALTKAGKDLVSKRMHSKFMGHQNYGVVDRFSMSGN